jgi:methionyl-tRNA synthetase
LVQRVFSFIAKNLNGEIPLPSNNFITIRQHWNPQKDFMNALLPIMGSDIGDDEDIISHLFTQAGYVCRDMNSLRISSSCENLLNSIFALNKYTDTSSPWSLRKTDPHKMKAVLANLLDGIRTVAILAQPFIPKSASQILQMFGSEAFDRAHIINHGNDLEVCFSSINDFAWYDRWANTLFQIIPPTPIFPRLELPEETAS